MVQKVKCVSVWLSLSLNKHNFWFTNPLHLCLQHIWKWYILIYGFLTSINSKDESYTQSDKFLSQVPNLRELASIGIKLSAVNGVTLTWTTDFVVYWSWLCLCSSNVQRYFHLWNTKIITFILPLDCMKYHLGI